MNTKNNKPSVMYNRKKINQNEESRQVENKSKHVTDSFFIKPSKSGQSNSWNNEIGKNNKLPKSKASGKTASTIVEVKDKIAKKPFDKKKWRMQKYSKKYKLQQWEDKRKKAVLREYYKIKDEDSNVPKINVNAIYGESEETEVENENNLNAKTEVLKKEKPLKRAHQEFMKIQKEKKTKKEEYLKKKAERDEALKMYKKNKIEKFKKLNRKTKRGQPIMKERMEMLLEKIQNSLK